MNTPGSKTGSAFPISSHSDTNTAVTFVLRTAEKPLAFVSAATGWWPTGPKRAPMLVAYGVRADGSRQLERDLREWLSSLSFPPGLQRICGRPI